MDSKVQFRMNGLVATQTLFNFREAAKALFCDLAYGEDEFDIKDVEDFVLDTARESMMWATATAKKPEIGEYPGLPSAILYVRRYVTKGIVTRSVAEQYAISLYDLDAEAVTVLKKELDEAGI